MTPLQASSKLHMLQKAIESLQINARVLGVDIDPPRVQLDRMSWTTFQNIVQPTYVSTYYACGRTTVTFSHLGVIFAALEPEEVQRAKD